MSKRQPYFPRARTEGILIQNVAEETLVYDRSSYRAHCLNRSAALVWHHCDGKTDVQEISQIVGKKNGSEVGEDFIWLALRQLKRASLLEQNDKFPADVHTTRREVIRKLGWATAIAIPVISSILVPTALAAVSCGKLSPCTIGGLNPCNQNPACTCTIEGVCVSTTTPN